MAHRRPGRPHSLKLPLPWAEVEALLRAGEVSMAELGRRYGVTPQSLRYWARKWGLPPRWAPKPRKRKKPGNRWAKQAVRELREARAACEASLASLREALGRPQP